MKIREILKISRPHFWLYEAGTFLVGATIAGFFTDSEGLFSFVFWFLYFLIPANILIYGVNDIFDYESDLKNPKKQEYEKVLSPKEHKNVWWWIALTNLPFVIFGLMYFLINNNYQALLFLALFIFFAVFYSAKPIRAKDKPFLDSFFSASHYVATGVFGFLLFSGDQNLNWIFVLAGILWAMSMHAYSAIPDIDFDRESGINTIATFLKDKKTLFLCLCFYVISFILVINIFYWFSVLFILIYSYLIFISFKNLNNSEKMLKIYKSFAFVNNLVGMFLFFYFLL